MKAGINFDPVKTFSYVGCESARLWSCRLGFDSKFGATNGLDIHSFLVGAQH